MTASEGSSVLVCQCLLSQAAGKPSGFGQMAVIGLVAVNQSNLTDGFYFHVWGV